MEILNQIQFWIQENKGLSIFFTIIIYLLIKYNINLWNERFEGKMPELGSNELEVNPQGIKVWKKLKFKGEGVISSDSPIKENKQVELSPTDSAVAQSIQSADPDLLGVQSNWIGQ